MRFIDDTLNKYTMYFVVQWSLRFLVGVSFILSTLGILSLNPLSLLLSLSALVITCYTVNMTMSKLLKVPANKESYAITALILFFILYPPSDFAGFTAIVLAGTLAMVSKFFITIDRRHIFNPAGFALVILGLVGSPYAQWWIGNQVMLPFVILAAIVIVRKVRKFQVFGLFVATNFITVVSFAAFNNLNVINVLPQMLFSYPAFFMGSVMLLEPLTLPPTKNKQLVYSLIIGFLSGTAFQIGPFTSSLELSLIIGNIYSYAVSFRQRIILFFEEKKELVPGIFEFTFRPDKEFSFVPGEYMEWTFSHPHPDKRGVRRFFSLASSPTEDKVRFAIRFNADKSSSYKKYLMYLSKGDKVYAGSIAGDFTLPNNTNEKLVFIAGGIGITPFRSMIQYLVDKREKRDIVVFYAASNKSDFVYNEIIEKAHKEINIKVLYITKRLDKSQIKREVPDYSDRKYYLSGPKGMVDSYKQVLRDLGISPHKIITDYFAGY